MLDRRDVHRGREGVVGGLRLRRRGGGRLLRAEDVAEGLDRPVGDDLVPRWSACSRCQTERGSGRRASMTSSAAPDRVAPPGRVRRTVPVDHGRRLLEDAESVGSLPREPLDHPEVVEPLRAPCRAADRRRLGQVRVSHALPPSRRSEAVAPRPASVRLPRSPRSSWR